MFNQQQYNEENNKSSSYQISHLHQNLWLLVNPKICIRPKLFDVSGENEMLRVI
jgi:hypothetical protein